MRNDVLVDVSVMAALLIAGNLAFGHFEPYMPFWRRVLKSVLGLAIVAFLSWRFDREGTVAFMGVVLVALLAVHGWWLPKNGVNGWTGEPKEAYYRLRGWDLKQR